MTLQQWLDQWSQKSTPVQERVRIAFAFMRRHYGARDEKILSEIKCIDFSRPVELPAIAAHTILIGSKDPRVSPYKSVYFTRSGNPADRLGISPQGRLKTDPTVIDKAVFRYEALHAIPPGEALQSTCAPAADTWSIPGHKQLAAGGGLQYLIPNMNRYLRFLP